MRPSDWHPWKNKLLNEDGFCLNSLFHALEQIYSRDNRFSQTAALDAQVLLAHILGKPRSWIIAHPEARLTKDQEIELQTALERLEIGQPLPYVLEHWEFYGLDFQISTATLIPRPETELMVEKAIGWLELHPEKNLVLDVGTGSGCIAVALAANLPGLQVVACDLSLAALQVAYQNVCRHGLSRRVFCLQADLIPGLGRKVDLICANLPYIPTEILLDLPVSRAEPHLALDGGLDGMSHIQNLLSDSPRVMASDSLLLIEIEAYHGSVVCNFAETIFPKGEINLLKDLAGHDRLIYVKIP